MEHQGLGMAGWKDMDGLCTYASQHSRLLCQLGPRLSVSRTGLFTRCLSLSLLYQDAQQKQDAWNAREFTWTMSRWYLHHQEFEIKGEYCQSC